ncbi:putative terminase large subunit [Acinetobacter phage Scuro]|nr:putative terminase large subunit [Acinetobacter phage Scuro]
MFDNLGTDWIISEVNALTHALEHLSPSEFNEKTRYLPESVTPMPGFIRYDTFPFLREILDCFDVDSNVREVNLKKGVQIGYSTLLESITLYYMAHVKTLPLMYVSADKELTHARVEENFIPMIQQSGLSHIIRSNDEKNNRKTGQTKDHIQFEGGGHLRLGGARNADKMRSFSICVMMKDEIDAWPLVVGRDGDPDKLTDDRCSAYWERRKIIRGTTPLIKNNSKIQKQYLRGDQRKYFVPCKHCGHMQFLRWNSKNEKGGFRWDYLENGRLDIKSVRYICEECGGAHYEFDKEKMFRGGEWRPTAEPIEPGIRSYHLPAFYSPIGFQPWYKSVMSYLNAYDPIERKVKDIAEYQTFYNNVLGEPFEIMGAKIRFEAVSLHRRQSYTMGNVPNNYAKKYAGSQILMLTCQVDVHKTFLAVSVMGWCREMRSFVIEYLRIEGNDFSDRSEKGWGELQKIIEEKRYYSDDGKEYRVVLTLIDAGYVHDTVLQFCADYAQAVYPILGRDRPSKTQTIKEFASFETQLGTTGYRIIVDHYKDRLAPVLRREWIEEMGEQDGYHFNAPLDTTDAQLKELTVETRREEIDAQGNVSYKWHRPGNARNELWDLLCYGHAAIEIYAWSVCIKQFGLKTVDWPKFWDYVEFENKFYVDNNDNKE